MRQSILLILISISIAYCGICDISLQVCDSSCTTSQVCVPIVGCSPATCSPSSALNPICVAAGCPNGQGCVGGGVNLCGVFSVIQNEVNAINAQITSLTNQVTTLTTKLVNETNTLTSLETVNKIAQFPSYFGAPNGLLGQLESLGADLAGLENTIISGFQVPIKVVQLFPKLFNSIQPDKIEQMLIDRGSKIVEWFTKGIVQAAEGLAGGASCATCLYTNLQNGDISFGISVDTGPGLGLSIAFATLKPLECFINSLAALAVIMKDLFPAELLQDSFAEVALLLVEAVTELTDFLTLSIVQSKICNTTADVVPTVAPPTTGVAPIDTLLKSLSGFMNELGSGGVFGSIAHGFVTAICSANYSSDVAAFAKDVESFVNAMSFPNIMDRVFQVIFDAISKISNGFATFESMTLDVPAACNVADPACKLVTDYGKSYLQCIQQQINSGALSISFGIGLGEHWLPPSITGWNIGIGCTTIDCWGCILGLKSGAGSIGDVLKLIVNDIMGSHNDENTRTSCNTTLVCTGGTWDATACACRCAGAFLTTGTGCQLCPVNAVGTVCNGDGACYNSDNGPACCCAGTVNSTNCV